jgi:cytochrome c oxidase assembly factor CtaG
MDPVSEAVLRSWSFDPALLLPLAATAVVYARGWAVLRRRGALYVKGEHLAAFLGGLAALWLALASPVEAFAGLLLSAHMVQHMLLMLVVPQLLLLGQPALPLLWGLPRDARRYWVGPVLRQPWLRACWGGLTWLPVSWGLFVLSNWLWHAPPFYELSLRSGAAHAAEHACFLGTALLFWWPVIQPYPSQARSTTTWSRWAVLPYLFLAEVQNTVLSALLTFSGRVFYPHYAAAPRLGGGTALEDQALAGVIMWVPGSFAFLLPLLWNATGLLFGADEPGRRAARPGAARPAAGRVPLPLLSPGGRPAPRVERAWDLLRVPVVGRLLRWRHSRLALQAPLFALAGLVVLDGLLGPQVAPLNLAGVLPWVHWRGLLVLTLLLAGNFFCLACPFQLPRTLARRWLPGRRRWPEWLRSKWLAVGLLVLFFWAYEAFALWASPWWTAWLVVGYFLAAFVVDSVFQGAAFCKYVCPLGQFNFVQALASPLEVRVRDADACLRCTTHDCLRGGPAGPGCGMALFQPHKSGNLDCTFCLDCVHACPHDNVGMLAAYPGRDLLHDPPRAGVGRFARRPDLAALVVVLVFAAFVNAAGMVAPVVEAEHRAAAALGLGVRAVVTAGLLGGLLVAPALLVGLAALAGRWAGGDRRPVREVACRFAPVLAPLGFGMWLAHYSFHLLAGPAAFWPALQRLAGDLGVAGLGEPAWGWCCAAAPPSWLLPLEITFLDLGLLLSLYAAHRTALERSPSPGRALAAFLPWGSLVVLLFAAGVWLVFQPMQMRGTLGM